MAFSGALAGGLITVLLGEFAAELAGVGDGTIAEGELAGGEYEVAGSDPGLIGSHGGGAAGRVRPSSVSLASISRAGGREEFQLVH